MKPRISSFIDDGRRNSSFLQPSRQERKSMHIGTQGCPLKTSSLKASQSSFSCRWVFNSFLRNPCFRSHICHWLCELLGGPLPWRKQARIN